MSEHYLLAIDQGTTGSTVLVIDMANPKQPTIIGRATTDFKQYYPQPGWVEHQLDEIWLSVKQSCTRALQIAAQTKHTFNAKNIAAIGITNQRETLCTFDRQTGQAPIPAIVWQCRRSADISSALKKSGVESKVREKTGLVLDPYFSATKMSWLLKNKPEIKTAMERGQLVWGTIDTYLLHRLTAGQVFATEPSNASRTMLLNLKTGQFDPELLEIFGIPGSSCLPEVKSSASIFGKTSKLDFLPDGIPIAGILGDQQAALAGQSCFDVGEAKCTYGTGAFLLLNTGQEMRRSKTGMLTTVAWSVNNQLTYAFEGASFIAGAAVQFLRDQLGIIPTANVTESMALNETAAPHVYFVPALAGLGAPYWDPHARGAFLGLTRGTSNAQLVRATLEGIAFQVNDLLKAMAQDLGQPIQVLRVDGGATANNLLMQLQANISAMPVDRPKILETTAFGAAMFAGLGVGLYQRLDDLKAARVVDKIFQNEQDALQRDKLQGWQRAVKAVQVFANHES